MKKYKKELLTILKAIFSLILVIFIYGDVFAFAIAANKKEILVYLLVIKWLLILLILYILLIKLKLIFKAVATKKNKTVF